MNHSLCSASTSPPRPVEDRQPLACPADREDPLAVLTRFDRAPVGQQPGLAERGAVPNRIDLEEVLVVAAEAHHPRRELHRVGDTGVARLRVDLEELAREIPDRPVGVVGAHDHLHDMADRALDQDDKLLRRRGCRSRAQLLNYGPCRARPLRALPVPKEPPVP